MITIRGGAFSCDNCGDHLTEKDLQGQAAQTPEGERVVSMARTPTVGLHKHQIKEEGGAIMIPHICEGCARKQGLDTHSSTLGIRLDHQAWLRKQPQRGQSASEVKNF